MNILKRVKRDFNKILLKATSLVVIGVFLFNIVSRGQFQIQKRGHLAIENSKRYQCSFQCSLRPLATEERTVINKDELSRFFRGLEDYALEKLSDFLPQEINLVSNILHSFPEGGNLRGMQEVLDSVFDSLKQANQCFIDYKNFPNPARRQAIRDSLINILRPACLDLVDMLDVPGGLPGLGSQLERQLDKLSLFNKNISLYTALYSHAVYFIDNIQILADFTEWLYRSENHNHRKTFIVLFNTTGIQLLYPANLPRPIQTIFFTGQSARYFKSVIYIINDFLQEQRERRTLAPGTLPKRASHRDITASI